MGLSVAVAPASEPLSIVEAKAQCRIDATIEDGLIAGYILSAREFIENDIHHRMITQTLDYTVDDAWPVVCARGAYRTRINLPVKPVASIVSITYVDANGATQTLAGSQYVLRKDGPVHFVEPAYGVTWPTVRDQTAAITVQLVAGWANGAVPNALMQAMRLLIAHQDANREPVNVGGSVSEVPMSVEAFLSPYRWSQFS